MIKKIILILILVLIFTFIQPNLSFLQGFNTKTPERNNVNLVQHRNNPKEYFKIILEKQKANATNIYLKSDTFGGFVEEYYKYNSFEKRIYEPKNTNTVMITTNKKGTEYLYLKDMKNDKVLSWAAIKTGKQSTEFKSFPYMVLSDRIVRQKYIGQKQYLNRMCSIWRTETDSSIIEQCFDEDLGISYYQVSYYFATRKTTELFKMTDIKLNTNTNKTFDFPKEIKAVLNFSFFPDNEALD